MPLDVFPFHHFYDALGLLSIPSRAVFQHWSHKQLVALNSSMQHRPHGTHKKQLSQQEGHLLCVKLKMLTGHKNFNCSQLKHWSYLAYIVHI